MITGTAAGIWKLLSPAYLFAAVKYRFEDKFSRPLRKFAEKLGVERFSKPYAVDGVEKHQKLLRHIDRRNGFFVETGGHDGYFHSPTYYFEAMRGWQGVLVEPVSDLYARCANERRASKVYNYACVGSDYKAPTIELIDRGHSSVVSSIDSEPCASAEKFLTVPAKKLADILNEYFREYGAREIDLLVLDVEGFEMQVLDGFDFENHRPAHILIEGHSEADLIERTSYLEAKGYSRVEMVSSVDALFRVNYLGV